MTRGYNNHTVNIQRSRCMPCDKRCKSYEQPKRYSGELPERVHKQPAFSDFGYAVLGMVLTTSSINRLEDALTA